MNSVLETLGETARGIFLWKKLRKKYGFSDYKDALFVCPETDEDYLNKIIDWLGGFCERRGIRNAIFISRVEMNFGCVSPLTLHQVVLDIKEINELLLYYRLTQFENYIYPLALTEPYGNKNLLGFKGLTYKNYLRGLG